MPINTGPISLPYDPTNEEFYIHYDISNLFYDNTGMTGEYEGYCLNSIVTCKLTDVDGADITSSNLRVEFEGKLELYLT